MPREKNRQLFDALDLVEYTPQFLVVDPPFERHDPVFEPHLAVLLPEEAGVGEAGA